MTKKTTKPRGPKRWSLLSPRQQYRLRHKRAKWRSESDRQYKKKGTELRELRNFQQKTQREMAEKLGVSLRQYKRYEAGESIPGKRK